MSKYESVILINDNLTEEKKADIINMIENFINENGEHTKTDIVGSKKMAYEIRGQKTAYYCVFYFNAEATTILELERIYRINEEIIKFLNVKVEE